jgi:hypothetical protein
MKTNDPLLQEVWDKALAPALVLLPPAMGSPQAWHQQLVMGLQESKLQLRAQVVNGGGKGPARGLWQFERAGGVKGVLEHSATAELARSVCSDRGVPADPASVWRALETDDVLAAAFARLLLWTDAGPMPEPNQQQLGWQIYQRTWRPGKPHPETWPTHWLRVRRWLYGD